MIGCGSSNGGTDLERFSSFFAAEAVEVIMGRFREDFPASPKSATSQPVMTLSMKVCEDENSGTPKQTRKTRTCASVSALVSRSVVFSLQILRSSCFPLKFQQFRVWKDFRDWLTRFKAHKKLVRRGKHWRIGESSSDAVPEINRLHWFKSGL